MATLDRRVQVLFDPAQYAALEAEATAANRSVAAVIREAVDDKLRVRRTTAAQALERLFERSDSRPDPRPIDWEAEKEAFDRDTLRDLP